jgi:hypothetical protein
MRRPPAQPRTPTNTKAPCPPPPDTVINLAAGDQGCRIPPISPLSPPNLAHSSVLNPRPRHPGRRKKSKVIKFSHVNHTCIRIFPHLPTSALALRPSVLSSLRRFVASSLRRFVAAHVSRWTNWATAGPRRAPACQNRPYACQTPSAVGQAAPKPRQNKLILALFVKFHLCAGPSPLRRPRQHRSRARRTAAAAKSELRSVDTAPPMRVNASPASCSHPSTRT